MDKIPWEQIFSFLERVVPTVLASFVVGYKQGQKSAMIDKKKMAETEYELEKMRNEKKIKDENAGKTSSDIVDDYMREREGRK